MVKKEMIAESLGLAKLEVKVEKIEDIFRETTGEMREMRKHL